MAEIITVPLSKLTASDANMRKTARESGIEELAAVFSIDAVKGFLRAFVNGLKETVKQPAAAHGTSA